MATVSDAVATWLSDKGITHAFGIIGGGNVALWDAIARHQKTQLVCVHHEQAAAMAASYAYRVGGNVAIALCTTGAGSSNSITGVLAAWMDSIPLMVISGNEASKFVANPHERGFGVQGYDSPLVAKPFVKLSSRLCVGDDVSQTLDWHHNTALQARQGPVWLDIPQDVQRAMV